jgi:hypothetical protein
MITSSENFFETKFVGDTEMNIFDTYNILINESLGVDRSLVDTVHHAIGQT